MAQNMLNIYGRCVILSCIVAGVLNGQHSHLSALLKGVKERHVQGHPAGYEGQ